MATVFSNLFLHVSGYDDAPELSVNDEGRVLINDELVSDEDFAAVGRALIDNAKAWGKCHAEHGPKRESVAFEGAMVVKQYTFMEIRGPWPAPAVEPTGDELTDEKIDEIEGGGDVVG